MIQQCNHIHLQKNLFEDIIFPNKRKINSQRRKPFQENYVLSAKYRIYLKVFLKDRYSLIHAIANIMFFIMLNSVQFNQSVMSDSLQPHRLQHARPPCPSPTPRTYSNSCPWCWWCDLTISSSVIPFSTCLQSFHASGSFPMSQFFASGGQSIGVSVSTSVLPMNIQDWFLLGWTGWIFLQSKGLSRVLSNTTVQEHQVFGTQISL